MLKAQSIRALVTALSILLTVACQKEANLQVRSKAVDLSFTALADHAEAQCPDLIGEYKGSSIDFNFRKRGGYLVISTKSSTQTHYSEIITVSGVEMEYGDGGRAEAKCVDGVIHMLHTSYGGVSTEIQIVPTESGFQRLVKKSRNAPVRSEFVKVE